MKNPAAAAASVSQLGRSVNPSGQSTRPVSQPLWSVTSAGQPALAAAAALGPPGSRRARGRTSVGGVEEVLEAAAVALRVVDVQQLV